MGPTSQWLPASMGPCDSEKRRVRGPASVGLDGGGTGTERTASRQNQWESGEWRPKRPRFSKKKTYCPV